MCDFSQEDLNSRDAQLGETLETQIFPSTSMGLITPGDTTEENVVCVQPDTKLELGNISEHLQAKLDVPQQITAIFHQENQPGQEPGNYYRDGFLFPNGTFVLLNDLEVGITVRIVALPAEDRKPTYQPRHDDIQSTAPVYEPVDF